jgi:RNA polymerase sigma factor (sigma-70 family)
MTSDLELLQNYARNKSEESFAALVNRHLNLVYSAAFRQVRSPQLAEEVAQSAFTDLARNAGKLKADTILTAWLYQVTRRTAIDVVRREARRQLREQIATEMNTMNATAADWTHIEPLLDEAMHALDDTDRAAVLLRYFENKSLREVGQTLGTSEDTAQKRVSRAVERLREFFAKHGVTVGASGLVVVISANAIQAAPVGLTVTISTVTALAGTIIATTATATAIKTIAMTTLQKTLITAAIAAAVGTGIYEAHQTSTLRDQVQNLQQQQAPLKEQIQQLQQERDDATRQLASLRDENERLNRNTAELFKLRGEVGALRSAVQNSKQVETDPIQIAAKSWLAKVDVLKKWIEERPEQQIPEFQYLWDYDWLDAVKTSNMMGDYAPGNAAILLRQAAKRQFAHEMSNALRRYVEEHNGDLPADLSQLNTYLTKPMNDAILKSYKLLHAGKLADLPNKDWLVEEIAPPFDNYDSMRIVIRTDDSSIVPREK